MRNPLVEKIMKAIEGGMAPGCSLVILKDNKVAVDFSCGIFSDQNKSEVTTETVFDLASITKLYTAAVILRLHESKKIDIRDKMSSYFPAFAKSDLTVLDMLTHRANFGIRLSEYRKKFGEKFTTGIFQIKPPAKPANEIHYENITYLFLGRLAELAKELPLTQIYSELLADLDLRYTYPGLLGQHSFFSPPTEIRMGLVIQNTTHDESAALMGGVAGYAGLFANAKDLARFGMMWLKGRVISAQYIKRVFTDYSCAGTRSQGLGWHQDLYGYSTKNRDIYLHSGYTGCLLAVHLPSSTVCAFLCNRTYYGRDNMKHRPILKMLVDYTSRR
jgi:CubicO group peptidase (beta-lactamase class C family)